MLSFSNIVLFSKRFGSGPSSVELTALLFILYNKHFLGLYLSVREDDFSGAYVQLTFDNSSCYIYQLFYSSIFRFGGKRRIYVSKTHTAHDAYNITHI